MAAHGARRLLPMADERSPPSSASSCWPPRRAATSTRPLDLQPAAGSACAPLLRATVPHARRRPLLRTRHRGRDGAGALGRGRRGGRRRRLPRTARRPHDATWLDGRRRGDAPADRQLAAHRAPTSRPTSSRALVSPWLGAQGRRLVDRPALRLRRRARRDHRAHRHLAHGHRREPRSLRRLALSGPGDDRAVPDHDLRRRAALPRRARSPTRRRSRGAAPRYFDPYHAALAAEIARLRASHPRVVLYDCHSIRSRHPAPVRRRAAGLQPRHQQRRERAPPR